jgi:hypothetical protein
MWDSYLKLDKISDVAIFVQSTFPSDKLTVKIFNHFYAVEKS